MSEPIAAALLSWYRQHHRRLPWRAEPDGPPTSPYAVLVSELMLQQTRVETVLDYFRRWMQRWPTLADLAQAQQADVLAQWTGLGYYNRARNLHATAQAVVRDHGGDLPADEAALRALPGLGPYTVGAVRSIAFGQPAALVDGNVARVLARWQALDGDPTRGAGQKAIWQAADRWLQVATIRAQPGNWNQALMELGATVCVPKRPKCEVCPVSAGCQAKNLGLQAEIPPVRQRAQVQTVTAAYGVIVRQGKAGTEVLLGRRPTGGRWAGLWEPPGLEGPGALPDLRGWLQAHGLEPAGRPVAVVHVLTHRRYEVQGLSTQAAPDADPDLSALGYTASQWLPIDQALSRTGGLSRLAQRLVEGTVELETAR